MIANAIAQARQRTAAFARTFARPPRGVARGGWHRRGETVMGTAIGVELWADDRAAATEAIDAVMAEMHRIDRAMSPFKADSELSRINRDAARAPVLLSDEMFALLRRAVHFSLLGDGAFDITYAAVGHLYDYRRGIAPGDAELARARACVGWRGLELDARARTVRFSRPGMRIDLGGFAKGHAVDNAAAILRTRGIAHAYVSAGGDSRLIGDRRGRPWTIGVRDPRRDGECIALLPLEDAAISTSGDYERWFVGRDGERCHHIVDPRTGRSPQHLRSVTIVAADGLTAEAASKTVFVLGVERGLAFIESQPGLDAVVVDADGRLHRSTGWLAAGEPPGPGEEAR